jgi:hypothetical protein
MDKLQGVRWITKLDIREGYYRIRIAKGHEWKTAFKTKFGLYEYMVMPFGLTNAPATFQSVINRTLHEYLGIFVTAYLDDILIYTKGNFEEHVRQVRKVLTKLRENDLLVNSEKSEFHVQETTFLGFIISNKGIRMQPAKVDAIVGWKEPNTVKEVQAFLGLANFYRKFIKDYLKVTAPLTNLTKKKQPWEWGEKEQKAFDDLKRLFTTAPFLCLFNPRKEIRVETDASDFALGAIMTQPQEDGKWRLTAFHSRKFNKHKINYDVFNKELLVIIDAFEH